MRKDSPDHSVLSETCLPRDCYQSGRCSAAVTSCPSNEARKLKVFHPPIVDISASLITNFRMQLWHVGLCIGLEACFVLYTWFGTLTYIYIFCTNTYRGNSSNGITGPGPVFAFPLPLPFYFGFQSINAYSAFIPAPSGDLIDSGTKSIEVKWCGNILHLEENLKYNQSG